MRIVTNNARAARLIAAALVLATSLTNAGAAHSGIVTEDFPAQPDMINRPTVPQQLSAQILDAPIGLACMSEECRHDPKGHLKPLASDERNFFLGEQVAASVTCSVSHGAGGGTISCSVTIQL